MIARALAGALLAAMLVSVASGAVAQRRDGGSDAQARARVHFEAGSAHYDEGNYEAALGEFEASYALIAAPELQYNIYLCHERLGNLAEAAAALRGYLDAGIVEERRATLEARLRNLEARAARARPGPVEAVPAEPTPAPAPIDGEAPASGGPPMAAWISFGAGGVGAAVLGIFGALALGERSDLENGCGVEARCTDDDVATLEGYAIVADVGLVVAVAGVAIGVVLMLLED